MLSHRRLFPRENLRCLAGTGVLPTGGFPEPGASVDYCATFFGLIDASSYWADAGNFAAFECRPNDSSMARDLDVKETIPRMRPRASVEEAAARFSSVFCEVL